MRTLTLELLRHGPSHNQLLSPLTPYLALCENHAPVTLNVPFEHNQFLHRLSALAYELNEKHRQFQLQDTGRELGRLLSAIPGLMAELGDPASAGRGLTHLRLVLSASELALLPFELVVAGNGFPGAGQPLLLQSESPICLTREVRRVRQERLQWTPEARILFICASPPGMPAVPVDSHLLALRDAIDPWVRYFDPANADDRRQEVGKHLTVLANASIRAIEEECSAGKYTHVHILAHGVAYQVGFDLRFGLALHSDSNPDAADIVSGDRLGTALRVMQQPDRDALVRPMVVTLASCNSGDVGSVVGVGGSIAHALQEAGVPLVLAGQFPLTFGGSVELVERMYSGLLWGVDPRDMLMDLRRRLHSQLPDNHDWAALTAYASLPSDFEEQLLQVQIQRAKLAVDAAMEYADAATRRVMPSRKRSKEPSHSPQPPQSSQAHDKVLATAQQKIVRAKERLRLVDASAPARFRRETLGLLASAEKRHAEVSFFWWSRKSSSPDAPRVDEETVRLLRNSQRYYRESFRTDTGIGWAVVQYLTLTLLLHEITDSAPPQQGGPLDLGRLWQLAETLSLNDLTASAERRGWALGNLIELSLLAMLMKLPLPAAQAPSWQDRAAAHVHDLLRIEFDNRFQIYSTRRQIVRFADWYAAMAPAFSPLAAAAVRLLALMPDESELLAIRLL